MEDIKPRSSRIIELKIGGTPGIRIMGVYAPPANRSKADKEEFYKSLKSIIEEQNNMRPTVIAGDWNVRLH
eukprot:11177431-Lingulodinium_polyedra.AAC.1